MFLETLLKCTGKDRSDTFWTSLAILQSMLTWTVGWSYVPRNSAEVYMYRLDQIHFEHP
jgi:hypothetical protein